MLQHVNAHVPEMVFGSQYPHVDVAQRDQLGTGEDVAQRRAVELRQTLV
jgi:hypothetical protein